MLRMHKGQIYKSDVEENVANSKAEHLLDEHIKEEILSQVICGIIHVL